MIECPRCTFNFVIEDGPSQCPACGLWYETDWDGEMWSDEECMIVSSWDEHRKMEPFDLGVQARIDSNNGESRLNPFDNDTHERAEWYRGWRS